MSILIFRAWVTCVGQIFLDQIHNRSMTYLRIIITSSSQFLLIWSRSSKTRRLRSLSLMQTTDNPVWRMLRLTDPRQPQDLFSSDGQNPKALGTRMDNEWHFEVVGESAGRCCVELHHGTVKNQPRPQGLLFFQYGENKKTLGTKLFEKSSPKTVP